MSYAVWHGVITSLNGDVVPFAQIEVRNEATGALTRLYADRDGAIGLSNPFQADEEGQAVFYTAGGAYKIAARSGPFERIWRYVGIGTAQEMDAEELGQYLQAGIYPFRTRALMDAFDPPEYPAGAVVLADPIGADNGYYTHGGAGWVFARPLPDTFGRLYVTGGDINNVQATLDAGVNPSAPTVFFVDVLSPNSQPVTLTINGANVGEVLNAAGNSLAPAEWQGRIFLTRETDGRYRIINDPASALSAALSASEAGDFAQIASDEADRAEAAAETLTSPVLYIPQTLTAPQRQQARDNIGATQTNAATVGAAIAGVSQVPSPAEGDRFSGVLSGSSTLFWTTWGNIKAALKTYFDGLYATIAAVNAKITKASDVGIGGFQSKFHYLPDITGGSITPDTTVSNFQVAWVSAAWEIIAPPVDDYAAYEISLTIINEPGAGPVTVTDFSNNDIGTYDPAVDLMHEFMIKVRGPTRELFIRKVNV